MSERASRVTQAFVDSVGDGVARVLVDARAFSLPVSALPEGTREGDWIELEVRGIPTPERAARTDEQRAKLLEDDDGRDWKL